MDGIHPRIFLVTSESESGKVYHVDLCEYELGLDENGNMRFNGACGLTNERIHGCKDFLIRCEPNLKKPENKGKVFRCKHVRSSREAALDIILPHIKRTDPSPNELQV